MTKEKRLDKLVDRQNEIIYAVAGIESIIKNHNEPLITKRDELVAEYNELEKEKEKLLPKNDEV